MADVTISYKGATIATMDDSGSKTLGTQGKYCEDDIGVEYVKPAGPSGTKQISITENGTTTEDVTNYANAEITVNVQGGVAIGPMEFPVSFSNTRSSTIAINRILYDPVTNFGIARANVTSSQTVSYSGLATDGEHIWVNVSSASPIYYNDNQATYANHGTDYMITIPAGFDGTIPFIIS